MKSRPISKVDDKTYSMKIKTNQNLKFGGNVTKSFGCNLKTDSFVKKLFKCKTNKKPKIAGPSTSFINYNKKSTEGSLLVERDSKLKQKCVVILKKINYRKVRQKYIISSDDCRILRLKKESSQPMVNMNSRKSVRNTRAKQNKNIKENNFHIQSFNSNDNVPLFCQNEENSTSIRRSSRQNADFSKSMKKQSIMHDVKNSLGKQKSCLQLRSENKKISYESISSKKPKGHSAVKHNLNENSQNNRQLQALSCKTTCKTPEDEKLFFPNLYSSPILRSNRLKTNFCDKKNNQCITDITGSDLNPTRSSLKVKNICPHVEHEENNSDYELNFVDAELSKKSKLRSSKKAFAPAKQNPITSLQHNDEKLQSNLIFQEQNSGKKENLTFCLLSEQGEIELEVIPANSSSINNFRLSRTKVRKSKKRINSSQFSSLRSDNNLSDELSIDTLIPNQNKIPSCRQKHSVQKKKKSSKFDVTVTPKHIHVDENSPRFFNSNINHNKDSNVKKQLKLSNHSLIEEHISYCSEETSYCSKKNNSPSPVCLLHIKTPERTILREVRHRRGKDGTLNRSILKEIKRGKDRHDNLSPKAVVLKKKKPLNQKKPSKVKLKKEKCATSDISGADLSVSTKNNKSLICKNICKVTQNEGKDSSNVFEEIDLISCTKDIKPNFRMLQPLSSKKKNISKDKMKRKSKAKSPIAKKKVDSQVSSNHYAEDEKNNTAGISLFTESKQPTKGSMKRKQWFVEKLNKHSEGHEDDLFEEKKFDVAELLAEDSDSSELYQTMLTPKREYTLAPQTGKMGNYEPCPSPVDLTDNTRKNADEYLYRRNKRQKIKVAEEKQNPTTETFEEKQTRLDIEKILQEVNDLKKPKKKRRVSDFIAEEDMEDYYFSDQSDDEISDFMND